LLPITIATGNDPKLQRGPADYFPKIKSLAFSAIITVAAWVLPDTSRGMMEASTTRKPSTPATRS